MCGKYPEHAGSTFVPRPAQQEIPGTRPAPWEVLLGTRPAPREGADQHKNASHFHPTDKQEEWLFNQPYRCQFKEIVIQSLQTHAIDEGEEAYELGSTSSNLLRHTVPRISRNACITSHRGPSCRIIHSSKDPSLLGNPSRMGSTLLVRVSLLIGILFIVNHPPRQATPRHSHYRGKYY